MTDFASVRTRLKPGMEEPYRIAHSQIWPELLVAQRKAGIKRWLIFRDGLDLFHSVEADNFEAAIAQLENNPVDKRWQVEMAQYTVERDDNQGPAARMLPLIYNGDLTR
ncbi:MAG: L-rhamnose mutarotase [Solirubrobacteraceae bacterium]|jgi:L-rhamnose mutarotase